MTEKFNIKNILFKSADEVKNKPLDKNNEENTISGQENIFKGSDTKTVDKNKILDESEKYTKEKYGAYTDNIDNFDDYTDLCEDLIEGNTLSKTADVNTLSVKTESNSAVNKSKNYESDFYTDKDGNKVEVRTFKDASGKIEKTQTLTTKTVTSGNPSRETVCTEKDKNGKFNFESKILEDFKSGTKLYKERDKNGNTSELYKDRDGNVISTKSETVDGPNIRTVETDKNGKQTVTNFTREPDGSILQNKTVIAANGTILYYSAVNKDISNNNIAEYILKNDENGNTVYERKSDSDLNRKLKSFEETETTFDENGNTNIKNLRLEPDGRIIKNDSVYTQNATCLSFSTVIEDPSTDSIYEHIVQNDENGRPEYELNTDKYFNGNIKSFEEITYYSNIENTVYTKNQVSETKSVHMKSDGDNYIATETKNLRTGEVTLEEIHEDGIITKVTDSDGNFILQTVFKPEESYANLFSGKSAEELMNFEKNAGSNQPGEYLTYEFIDGVKTLTSGYHIDADGKRTPFSENDKAKISLNEQQDLNGNIETSYQQATGDCWLLSGVNSLSYSEKGREIIEDALEYNNDGATVHTYFGDYSFSYEEIEAATREFYSETEDGRNGKKYVEGDADVVVFEMAIEQIRSDISKGIYDVRIGDFLEGKNGKVKPKDNVLDGGTTSELIYYLTGNQSTQYFLEQNKKVVLNRFMENYETSALSSNFRKDVYVTDINGNEIELHDRHAYSIKSYDGETVTIVNPWNSGEDITISADDFLKYSKRVIYTDLSTIEKDNGLFENDMFWFSFYASAMSK